MTPFLGQYTAIRIRIAAVLSLGAAGWIGPSSLARMLDAGCMTGQHASPRTCYRPGSAWSLLFSGCRTSQGSRDTHPPQGVENGRPGGSLGRLDGPEGVFPALKRFSEP